MRLLPITVLVTAAVLNLLIIGTYIKTVHSLTYAGLDSSGSFLSDCIGMRNDIRVSVWEPLPFTHAWAHSGFRLFQYLGPEGVREILGFPSWYLLIMPTLMMVASVLEILRERHRYSAS
jgi:hypothetical protein